jgi:2-C-methyl-D-erythritol 4-phosphate cytidylyltransferase
MRVAAIVPAAGEGKRMGEGRRKPFLLLGGRPILAVTLANLMRCPQLSEFLVCLREEDMEVGEREILPHLPLGREIRWVEGGARRQDSVFKALSRVSEETEMVLIHDGVRPFISSRLLSLAIEETKRWGATTFGLPVTDTIKLVRQDGLAVRTLDRGSLWVIQTPQTFRRDIILEAHRRAREEGFEGPDDASLVERLGREVKVLVGHPENIKITDYQDLSLAEKIAAGRGANE